MGGWIPQVSGQDRRRRWRVGECARSSLLPAPRAAASSSIIGDTDGRVPRYASGSGAARCVAAGIGSSDHR